MQARVLPAALILALVPLACVAQVRDGGSGEPKPDTAGEGEVQADVAPSEGDDAGAEVGGDDVEADPTRASSEAALPECPADAGPDMYCNADNQLVGQWMLVDLLHIPKGAKVIFDAHHVDVDRQPGLTLAIEGETLYIRHVTCGACRRILGDGFRGQPAQMSEKQLREMQTRLGLGVEMPLLDSTEAVERFASDERGQAKLGEISLQSDAAGGR
jgi:hypothetical protein